MLKVSKSGYYKWNNREISEQQKKKEYVTKLVKYYYYDSGEIYGYRKVHILVNRIVKVSIEYIRKIMHKNKLFSKVTKKYKNYRKTPVAKLNNELNQTFKTSDNKIVTDLTQIRINNKKVFISATVNLKNRRLVSIKSSHAPNADLVIDTLVDTLDKIKFINVLHSDQGTQYQSIKVMNFCNLNGINQSMSKRGCPYDNAPMESFFSCLKRELLNHHNYKNINELQQSLERYCYEFYNKIRPHMGLGGLSPAEYTKVNNLIY